MQERSPHGPPPSRRVEAEPEPGPEETAAEAAGGVSGAVLGGAIGSFGGPAGAIIGAIAGAVGGWWAGKEVAEDDGRFSEEDERYYRTHWESLLDRPAGLTYERARLGYLVGHLAGRNPEYRGRRFEELEPDLRRGWEGGGGVGRGARVCTSRL